LRPFFSYFGSKYRLARQLYPAPTHDTIIEPFAGSACYSVVNNAPSVLLNDVDPIICAVWSFLIRSTPRCIMSLPLIEPGQDVANLGVCQEAQWFIGFWLNKATSSPNRKLSAWALKYPQQFWGEHKRQQIAKQVNAINHWQVSNKQFYQLENQTACWFIDPPYQVAGKNYRCGTKGIDYAQLGAWCASRTGQLIVCENEGADWLPFSGATVLRNARNKGTKEVAYVSDGKQANLFGAKI